MSMKLNAVKKRGKKTDRSYHHGALRVALMDAAVAVIEEAGVDGFSLREVARRTGVSPAAPAHHFGDARGLLTAVAIESFRALVDALVAADANDSDRQTKILDQSEAYLNFAITNRGRYQLMWRKGLLDMGNQELVEAAQQAFGILDRTIRSDTAQSFQPGDPSQAPTLACWALVHGLAMLALEGALAPREVDLPEAIRVLLPNVLRNLHV